jgi:hypothetical protein
MVRWSAANESNVFGPARLLVRARLPDTKSKGKEK